MVNGDRSLSSFGSIRSPLFPFVNVFPDAIIIFSKFDKKEINNRNRVSPSHSRHIPTLPANFREFPVCGGVP